MTRQLDPSEATCAAVLPEASRGRLSPWLEEAGYRPCTLDEHPAIAVVDLTADGGEAALAALREDFNQYAVLAVVGDSHQAAERSLKLGADGFVGVSLMEREFDLRLEAVRRMAVSRLEQARREQDLAVLLDLTAHYASALDVAALLHDVTRRLADELSIDRCSLVLIDEERGLGHIVAASDDRAVRDLRIELSRYPEVREAMRTGQPVVVDDVDSHPLLGEVKEAVAACGIAALAAVPLAVHRKTLGVLLLRASAGTRFQPHEISFAWTVAHATAIALRNARMLERLRGQALKAEAQVAELTRYEEFFVYLSEGVVILDPSGTIVSINPAGAGILGLTPESAKGRMFASFASPLSEAAVMELLAGIARGERPRDIDLDAVAEDGRRLILCVSGAELPGGAGSVLSVRDVTQPRAMERELRKTKEFLEKLIDSSVDAIIASDMQGQVILYNKSAERVFGWTQKEALRGLDVRKLYPEGMAQKINALIVSEDHGGAGRLEPTRTELVSKGGEHVPVLMSAALIYEANKPVATVGVINDLRERAQLEAKLSLAEERLEEAGKQAVIVELAGTAAHELNQPLTSVMGYADLLRRSFKEQDLNYKRVDIIYREAERMAEIVRKIGKITLYKTKAYVGNARIVDLDRATRDEE